MQVHSLLDGGRKHAVLVQEHGGRGKLLLDECEALEEAGVGAQVLDLATAVELLRENVHQLTMCQRSRCGRGKRQKQRKRKRKRLWNK
jgi:hypothetical protein